MINSQREEREKNQERYIQHQKEHEEPKAKMVPLNIEVASDD
jgi:hypothetical protein